MRNGKIPAPPAPIKSYVIPDSASQRPKYTAVLPTQPCSITTTDKLNTKINCLYLPTTSCTSSLRFRTPVK